MDVAEAISHLPIGGKPVPVRKVTPDTVVSLRPAVAIIAKSAGKPITMDIAMAYIAVVRALVGSQDPELTDDHLYSWLSQGLCNMAAQEYLRQFVEMAPFARA